MIKRVTAWLAVERHRAYLYRVGTGVGAVAVAYGVVDGKELDALLVLLAQTLGVGLAARHTSTRKENNQ